MIKHTTYLTIARPPTIGGIPRIALIVSVLAATIPYPILSLIIDQMIAFVFCAILLCVLWVVMKIISLRDPDAILIAAIRIMKIAPKGKYAA